MFAFDAIEPQLSILLVAAFLGGLAFDRPIQIIIYVVLHTKATFDLCDNQVRFFTLVLHLAVMIRM